MPNSIFIISHNNHTFLQSELIRASESFEHVLFLAPYGTISQSVLNELKNVSWYSFNREKLKTSSIYSLRHLCEQQVKEELFGSIAYREFNLAYFKEFIFYLAFRDLVQKVANEYGVLENADKWKVLSMWYAADAYAANCLKSKSPRLSISSLVHSYEVDPAKNEFIFRLFRREYHDSFELVSFISAHVKDAYIENVAKPLNLRQDNISVCHLGIDKLEDGFCARSNDGVFRILSCSHIVPVKRIELLFEALEQYSDCPIEWFHIGSGPDLNLFRDKANRCTNRHLSITFLGSLPNEDIHRFYVRHPIDLFVNVSKSEGVPVSIMEAIAYGVPVLATNVGGNSEIVQPDFGCLLSADPLPLQIWKKIKLFACMPQNEIEAARKSARAYFAEQYDSKLIRKSFYQRLKEKA